MGRPQPEIASPYPPESDPQPQNLDYTPEEGNTYNPEEISSSAYEPQSAYPAGNDAVNQQQFQPPTQDPQPSPYPPQNQTNNASYPPQPAQYPPANPQPAFSSPAGYGTRSPVNFPPPNPSAAGVQQYPPANPQPAFSTPAGYGTPPPVNFPPPNPSAAGVQQYPPPPSPYKPYQQNSAAPGFPVQQPPMQPYRQNPGTAAWNTGLFDCMDDPMNAVVTALFPCLTFGQIAEIVDGGHTTCGTSGLIYGAVACCIALPCIYSCTYRTKLRSKYDLVEAPAPDWITHFFCEWCALCQEYRELKIRGLDPDLGWHGNMARQQNNPPQVEMAPPMRQAMMG